MSQTKCCSKCGEVKELSEFNKNKSSKYGVRGDCKVCKKDYAKTYYKENADQRKERGKKWRAENKEYQKTYYKENAERLREKQKTYYKENADQRKEYLNEYCKTRRKTDPLFKLLRNTRSLISRSLSNKGYSKTSRTHEILGCSYEELYEWLNTKANNNLTPYDDTHTDHVIPVSWGKTEEEVLALNHYSNLQLLSPEENLTKGGSAPLPENYERVLANHPNPQLIERIYAARISEI